MAYTKFRTITFDHTQVPSGQTNIPMLLYGTISSLKTVGNGGQVQNASGFDIVLATSNNGSGLLKWEVVSWDGTTGAIEFWVQVPTLSASVDTVIYLVYGNSSITTDQSATSSGLTWDSNYIAVYHFGTASSLVLTSSAQVPGAGNVNLTSSGSPSATAGLIGGAFQGTGSTYAQSPNFGGGAPWPSGHAACTLEIWSKSSDASQTGNLMGGFGGNGSSGDRLSQYIGAATFGIVLENDGAGMGPTPVVGNDTNWHFVAVGLDGSSSALTSPPAFMYFDGSLLTISVVAGSNTFGISNGSNSRISVCSVPVANVDNFKGLVDEYRISAIKRSSDWLTSQYNNTKSGATTPTVGAEQNVGNTTTNQTILGQSSIAVKTNQTILGQSDIRVTTNQTILGQADITAKTNQTILGQSSIRAVTSQTIQGQADITTVTDQTILGQSSIAVKTNQTILGQSSIVVKTNQTILGQASIRITTDQTILGQSSVTNKTNRTLLGQSFIQKLDSCFTFEGLPLGYNLATGWPAGMTANGGPVVTSQTALSGFTRYARLNGTLTYPSVFAIADITIVGNFIFGDGNGWGGTPLIFRVFDGINAADLCFLTINYDGTVGINTNVSSSTPFGPALHFNRWYWIQMGFQLIVITDPITMVKEVWVSNGVLWIDNFQCVASFTGDTGFTYDQVLAGSGGFGFNQVLFKQAGNSTGFTNFCILNYNGTIIYPNPGFPNVPPPSPNIRMRVAQGFAEPILHPTKSHLRVSQGVIEPILAPIVPNMRIAQGVIELLKKVTPPTPQPPPPVPPSPPTGRGSPAEGRCGPPQIVPTILPTVPDPPIMGIPNPPPPSSPPRYCISQLAGPPRSTN